MTPNKSPRRWNLDNCGRGPSAKHSTTPAADLIESPRGLAYESLTRRCVIIDPLHPHPPLADGRPCRQMTAQTGSVWLGYTEQTLAATWWLDMAYICSPHQRRQGPAACIAALSSRFSVLRLSPSVTLFLSLLVLFEPSLSSCLFTCPDCGPVSLISK